MLRLSKAVLTPATADYCISDSASAWTTGKHLIVCLNREDEAGVDEWDIGGERLLSSKYWLTACRSALRTPAADRSTDALYVSTSARATARRSA